MDKLEIGTQSREDVVRLVGSPSSVATFNPNVWYYITEKQENWGPLKAWIAEQNVIQVTFNDQGRIANIKYYDLKDPNANNNTRPDGLNDSLEVVGRYTPADGSNVGFKVITKK